MRGNGGSSPSTVGASAGVRIPVQLWQAGADAILPAGHYDFLPPCSPGLAADAPQICTPTPGFDRAAFHRDFNRDVVRFFRETL